MLVSGSITRVSLGPKKAVYMKYGVELSPVRMGDLPQLRRWRNLDAVRMQMVNTDRILPHQQRSWFESIQHRQDQVHWVIRCGGQRAGYVNLKGMLPVALQGQAIAETGLYLGPSEVRHPMLAIAAAMAQLDHGFEQAEVGMMRTLVRHDNSAALRLDQQLGYQLAGTNGDFLMLELLPDHYFKARERMRRFFR